ncbi:MAG: nicotinate-nucleotide adenylyltransferase [Aggregatilineales bacterium]|nr:nicotinate (nicotinamide) nucleotide adenylyltransferase [Chloroflexota bacterium]HOA24386.1 nicotinate-nucleotide adenylyltransferase [Aggregatilineales bacterium]HPV05943.1 nicotinate-nucleotide adenylyltransferase [Aggregatilineales bacterium]HQE19483.1 nicotinate-nucleotide adenylyltransferase [Aggregatilineales bacterium]
MRLGVLGGTFDPPHYGHLILAEQAREQLSLARVLWVPAADPPHKQGRRISPVNARLEMVSLAIAENPAFELCEIDVNRPGPHYTADMLALLNAQYPQHSLVFLIGGDSLRDIITWHDPARIIEQARLGVMDRPGAAYDLHSLEALIPGLSAALLPFDAPLIDISGSDIRARVAAGRSIRYMLPPHVEMYIYQHALYQD